MKPCPSDRIPCQVIGCGRTTKDLGTFSEWICGDHYRLVSRRIKRLRARVRREQRGKANTILSRINLYLWREAKRQAIERAMGITA